MRRRLRAAIVLGLALVAVGCTPAAFRHDRQSAVEAVDLDATLRSDGTVAVSMTVTFVDDDGGLLPVPEPVGLASTSDVVVNGEPASPTGADFNAYNFPVTGRTATATFVLVGATERHADGATVLLPLFASPSDASRQDPDADLTATVHLPAPVDPTQVFAQWNNGLDRTVTAEGARVTAAGKTPLWTSSELALVLAAELVPTAPDGLGTANQFRLQQEAREPSNQQLDRTLDSQALQQRIADLVLIGVCGLVGLLVLVGFIRANRALGQERRRVLAAAPQYEREPPDDLDPALVGVLVGDGRALDQDAVAGTVLGMAAGRRISIDGIAADRFVVRVPTQASGSDGGEEAVLAAMRSLRAAQPVEAAVEVVAPPLFDKPNPPFWRAYRRDAFRRAKARGLIERRFRVLFVGPFAATIPTISWPFVDRQFINVVPWLAIGLGFLVAIPLGGGYRLARSGLQALGRWQAFARYVRDHGELKDLGAAAVNTWGPYLAYAAVLGGAPRAARDLAPTGGEEKGGRREIDRAIAT